jgi:hypothetical protein
MALGQAFASVPFAREALVGMGDLAVPTLASLVAGSMTLDDRLDALARLGAIGTPTAAGALVPFLWHGAEPLVERAAAWQLASLIRSPDVEDELATSADVAAPVGAANLDWVWLPFADESAPIVKIMGRVAWLVSETGPPAAPWDPGALDPRIGMPAALRRRPGGHGPVLEWTGQPPEAVRALTADQHRMFQPDTADRLERSAASQLLANRLRSRNPLSGPMATIAADFLELILPQAGFSATASAAIRRLDLTSRLVVVMLGLRGDVITERRWRGIFAPRRGHEGDVYVSLMVAVHAGLALLGLVATLLSASGVASWGPGWARIPLAVVVGVLFLQVITMIAVINASDHVFDAALVSGIVGILLGWALAPVALFAWMGWAGFLGVFGGALLGTGALVVLKRWRAPANPVRDAIVESRLALGRGSTVLS